MGKLTTRLSITNRENDRIEITVVAAYVQNRLQGGLALDYTDSQQQSRDSQQQSRARFQT